MPSAEGLGKLSKQVFANLHQRKSNLPFLAAWSVAEIQSTAILIPATFYVDDFIYGADTTEAVLAIFSDLIELLSKRCFGISMIKNFCIRSRRTP